MLPVDFFWAKALPAADFEAALVRLSCSTFEAALAAGAEVVFFGAFTCASALPAADFDFAPVCGERRVFDAFLAAARPVVFGFATVLDPFHPKPRYSTQRTVRYHVSCYLTPY